MRRSWNTLNSHEYAASRVSFQMLIKESLKVFKRPSPKAFRHILKDGHLQIIRSPFFYLMIITHTSLHFNHPIITKICHSDPRERRIFRLITNSNWRHIFNHPHLNYTNSVSGPASSRQLLALSSYRQGLWRPTTKKISELCALPFS